MLVQTQIGEPLTITAIEFRMHVESLLWNIETEQGIYKWQRD